MKVYLLKILGLLFCTLPPAAATLCYFPLWVEAGAGTTVSGAVLLLLTFAFLPCYRLIHSRLASPATYTMWLIAFLLFWLLEKIAAQMIVISFFGFLGNLAGALLFRAAKRQNEKEKEEPTA